MPRRPEWARQSGEPGESGSGMRTVSASTPSSSERMARRVAAGDHRALQLGPIASALKDFAQALGRGMAAVLAAVDLGAAVGRGPSAV